MPVRPPKVHMPPQKALRAFEAAARHESFVRAAEELCVTPGAVAQQVKLLEDWLGSPLFERHSHGIVLTPHGRRSLPHLTSAIDLLGTAVQALPAEARPTDVHIAALPAVAQLWLSPRLHSLKRAFPDMQVSLTALEEPPNFKRDLYDIGLFYSDNGAEECETIVLATDRLVPVCAPWLKEQEKLSKPSDLRGQVLLHDTAWKNDWRRWLSAARERGFDPTTGPAYSLYSIALQSAIDGNGVLIGREVLVSSALSDGRLVAPFDLRIDIEDKLNLLIPTHRARKPFVDKLAAWIVQAV
jgi:LysR family glycine cleavage system transcriptional activator